MIKNILKSLFEKIIRKIIFLIEINEHKKSEKNRKKYEKFLSTYLFGTLELLKSILNKNIKEKEVIDEINKLNSENKKIIIDHILNIEHPSFIFNDLHKNNDIFKIIDILSKEDYYREEIIKKIKKRGKITYFKKPVSMIKSLEVFTKEDFFVILNNHGYLDFFYNQKSCLKFFVLNYKKFDYTEEEKENLKEIFPKYYFLNTELSIKNIEEIREKTSLCNIFPEIYKNNVMNKDNFNFFVDNIKNINDDDLKCSMIFYVFFGFFKNKEKSINSELYLLFFEKNINLIKIFETYIRKTINVGIVEYKSYSIITTDLEYVTGLAEKLIFEKQLKDF